MQLCMVHVKNDSDSMSKYQFLCRAGLDVKKASPLQFDLIWRHEVGELMFCWSLGQYMCYIQQAITASLLKIR